MSRMPLDAADIRRRHAHAETSAPSYSPDTGICASDRQKWPCEVIRLLDELEAVTARLPSHAQIAAAQTAATSPAPRFDLLLTPPLLTRMWWEQRTALNTLLAALTSESRQK